MINIAIDGYSACGKSTLAKDLAKRLSYRHIDSGAMYRAITHYFLKHSVDHQNESSVREALRQIHLDFQTINCQSVLSLNGQVMRGEIRSHPVDQHVSAIAAIPAIRSRVVAQQQKIGMDKGVCHGRPRYRHGCFP